MSKAKDFYNGLDLCATAPCFRLTCVLGTVNFRSRSLNTAFFLLAARYLGVFYSGGWFSLVVKEAENRVLTKVAER